MLKFAHSFGIEATTSTRRTKPSLPGTLTSRLHSKSASTVFGNSINKNHFNVGTKTNIQNDKYINVIVVRVATRAEGGSW